MASQAVAARIGKAIERAGATWMARPVMDAGRELGFSGYPMPFYMIGRGGVLGDVDADVVSAAMVFPSAALVRRAWEAGRQRLAPDAAAARFIACGHSWARANLNPSGDLERFNELGERLVASLIPAGAPLAMGWRAVPLPADPPARAIQHVHVLREHRGGLHATAVIASGLSPLEAIIATGGEKLAAAWGWEAPFPDREACRVAKQPVEETTNRMASRAYGALDEGELTELAALAEALVVGA